MSNWDDTTPCVFRGCVLRFATSIPACRAVCPWHGKQGDEPTLTDSIATKFLQQLEAG